MNTKRLHLDSAVRQNGGGCRCSLDHKVLSTFKIGQILPLLAEPCLPGDKFTVRVDQFARFQPLAVPAYVDLAYRTMSVFVPYHQVFDGCEAFMSNLAKFKGVNNGIPYITHAEFVNFMVQSRISSAVTGEDVSSAEFKNGTSYYRFTALGHYVVKVLRLLGYGWQTRNSAGNLTQITFPAKSNALPLLSFAHAYNSYMSFSATYNTSALSNTLEVVKRQPGALSTTHLMNIFTSILLTYEDSIYSSAWSMPYASNPAVSAGSMDDVFKEINVNTPGSYNEILAGGDEGAATTGDGYTAAQMRLLQQFDLYFRRTNYAGSKDVEQIYSRFGVKIDDYKTRYPYFLGQSAQQVRIGDVTSTSDTDGAPIGAYAGKAISDGSANFNFDCNDYGMLFVFAWFAPMPLYYNGIEKEVLRLTPFDYYTPEFDKGFASAKQRAEINLDSDTPFSANFGFVPLYSEYLYANDRIVGDFARFNGMEAWHFGRNPKTLGNVYAQDDSLIYLSNSGTEFERIFNIQDTDLIDADTIYSVANCSVNGSRPMRDFSSKSLLGEGNIDLNNQGSQMN